MPWDYIAMTFLMLTGVLLMFIVLLQRGRGGGLAGAFGGAGGQSAFGTKAGDLFTKITIVVATVWILLCLVALKVMGTPEEGWGSGRSEPSMSAPEDPDADKKEDGSDGDGAGATDQEDGTGSPDDAPAEKKDE